MKNTVKIKRFMKRQVDDPGSSGSLQDLSFLLIIFFIVIAGFNVNKGFLLNLPEKSKARVVQTKDLMKCILMENGIILLDGNVVNQDELKKIVSEKKATQPNMTFFLIIEPETSYQNVINIIHEIRHLDVENFSFKMQQ